MNLLSNLLFLLSVDFFISSVFGGSEKKELSTPLTVPSVKPMAKPSNIPTKKPNLTPSGSPTLKLTKPTIKPTASPSGIILSSKKAPTSKEITPISLPICQYAGYCNADSDCYPGNYCNLAQMPYYSQCLPKPSTYKTSNCLANFYGSKACSANSDCCDPGAYCNSNTNFKQCQQPVIGSGLCSNPGGFSNQKSSKPVSQPVQQPIAKPTCQSVLPICQYAGYCKKDSDCYAGNYCRLDQLPYYTQCLPKPSTYKSVNCLANNYGNNQQCSSTSDCCDPGAFCNNLGFRQCQQPAIGSPVCSNPSKFIDDCISSPIFTPTANPINTPTGILTNKPTTAPTKVPSTLPTANPTYSAKVILAFKQILSLQGINCTALSKCLPCQSAIAQTVYQTLHLQPPDVTVYITCSVLSQRRRLFEVSRNLIAVDQKTNVTVGVTIYTNDPKKALADASNTMNQAVSTNALTNTLNTISKATPGAEATSNVVVYAVTTNQGVVGSTFPSKTPTTLPSLASTIKPSVKPTVKPSLRPTDSPSVKPTVKPSMKPTDSPSVKPTVKPSSKPIAIPTLPPIAIPTLAPVVKPSIAPSTLIPTDLPTKVPSGIVASTIAPTTLMPTDFPTDLPTKSPISEFSKSPTDRPTNSPVFQTKIPTDFPTAAPMK